jgi:hypothetical protein
VIFPAAPKSTPRAHTLKPIKEFTQVSLISKSIMLLYKIWIRSIAAELN